MPTLPVPANPYPVERVAATHRVDVSGRTLRELISTLFRNRLILFLSVVLSVGLGVAYTVYARPVYQATSVLRFEVDRVDLPQLVELVASENLISTELEMLRSRSAALAVVDSLGLRVRLVAPRRARRSELFSQLRVAPAADSGILVLRAREDATFTISGPDSTKILGSARIGDTVVVQGVLLALKPAARGLDEIRLRVDLPDDAIERLQSGVKASRPARDADLISIRARAGDPAEASAIANLLAENVIAGRQTFRQGRTDVTTGFLREQADTLRRQLHDAEESLRAYQEREHVVDAPEQARSQVARLAGLQADLAVIRADRDAFAKLIEQLRADTVRSPGQQSPSRRFIAFPSLLRNESASTLLAALAQVENQRAELLIRRTPADSDVQVLTARIGEIENQLQGIAESFQQSLANQAAALEAEAAGFGVQLDGLPEKELQSARRERDAKVLNDLWVLVQTRLKESEITGEAGDPNVRLVDAAAPALRRVRPSLPMNLALSLVLGSMLGITLSVARELGNRPVRSRADAQAAAGLSVLGAIPRLRRRGLIALPWRRLAPPDGMREAASIGPIDTGLPADRYRTATSISSLLVTRHDTPAAYVESFNQIFVNLALAHHERPLKVVVFTSPLPGEGKSLSAVNFALIGASRGLRMLLVDADLRCGVLGTVLGCGREPGFAELLGGTVQASDVLRQVAVGDYGSLTVIPSGALPKVPGRILTVERVREVLGALAPTFDFVVIDTPPVNLLADAALLGSESDAVLVVVRAGRTQSDALSYAMDQLEAAGVPVLGTLLNDIDLRRHGRDDGTYRYIAEAERYYERSG